MNIYNYVSSKNKGRFNRTLIMVCLALPLCLNSVCCNAASFEHHGKIAISGGYNDNVYGQLGLRYIPEFSYTQYLNENLTLDAEFALNLFTYTTFDSFNDFGNNADASLYRSWLRLSGNMYEVRVGLQKINFGPGRILRSLKWFDQVDPLDPLKLTDGVYGILGKYYFANNSSIWVWGLYGNDDPKGLEVYRSDEYRPEFGFRYQFPVAKGEMAVTYHNRRIEDINTQKSSWMGDIQGGVENRYAIDGSFDIGIGLWFEAVFSHIDIPSLINPWTRFITIGADYTFDVGNGVHVIGEHFVKSSGSGILDQNNEESTSAISVDFSTGISDTITLIGYFDWQKDKFSPNVSWQRTYDNWLINITAFHNSSDSDTVYSGTGLRCTVTYNY